MSFSVFSLDSAKHLFQMELIKQFKDYPTPQSYVKVEGTIDDVATRAVRNGEQWTFMVDKSRQSKLYYVLKKAIVNQLGMTDWVTYLLMFTKKWYKGWSNEERMDKKKYYRKDGVILRSPDKINKYNPFMTALVVVTPDPKIYYCKLSDLNIEMTKNPEMYQYFTDSDGLIKSGAPRSIFTEKDVF